MTDDGEPPKETESPKDQGQERNEDALSSLIGTAKMIQVIRLYRRDIANAFADEYSFNWSVWIKWRLTITVLIVYVLYLPQ